MMILIGKCTWEKIIQNLEVCVQENSSSKPLLLGYRGIEEDWQRICTNIMCLFFLIYKKWTFKRMTDREGGKNVMVAVDPRLTCYEVLFLIPFSCYYWFFTLFRLMLIYIFTILHWSLNSPCHFQKDEEKKKKKNPSNWELQLIYIYFYFYNKKKKK